VIAVVGSASGSGKTRLACAVLRAIPGLGAVKISPRAGSPLVEWGPGEPGKDTARFAESGAAVVARIAAPRGSVPAVWDGMRGALEGLPGIVVEGAGALGLPAERFTVFVAAVASLGERAERDERLAAAADCIVMVRPGPAADREDPSVIAQQGGRVGVLRVSMAEEQWELEPLLDAIRGFLPGQAGTEAQGPLSPRPANGNVGV
jgi:hypothetical protein